MPISPITFGKLGGGYTQQGMQDMQTFISNAIKNKYLDSQLKAALENAQAMAQQEQAKAKYADPRQQAEMQQEQYKAQYAPQDYESTIGLREAQSRKANLESDYYPQDTQSQINLRGAQANLYGQQAKYEPLKNLVDLLHTQQTATRFGKAYEMSRVLNSMPAEQRELWISQNQGAYVDMLNDMADKASQEQDGSSNKLLQAALGKYYPEMMSKGVAQQGQQNNISPQIQNPQGMPQPSLQDVSQQNRKFGSTSEQEDQMRLAAEMAANNKSAGTKITGRAKSGVALDSFAWQNREKYVPRLNNALKYSGGAGNLQKRKDQVAAATGIGRPSKGYVDLLWAKNDFKTAVVNQIKQMEQMGATDEQREEMQNLLKAIDSFDVDPKSARELFNKSMETFGDLTSSLINAAEPLVKGTYKRAYDLPDDYSNYLDLKANPYKPGAKNKTNNEGVSKISDAEIEMTAKRRGMTPEQVRAKLAAKGIR